MHSLHTDYSKTKQLTSSFSKLLFLLCMYDCSGTIIVLPMVIVMFTTFRNTQNCTFELVLVFIHQTAAHLSIYTIFALALLRYSQVNSEMLKPMGWKKKVISNTGTVFLIVASFTMAVLSGLASSYMFGCYYNRVPNWIIKALDSVLLVLTLCFYSRLFCKVKKYAETSTACALEASNNNSDFRTNALTDSQRPRYFKKLTVTVFLTFAALLVLAIPFIITDATTAYYEDFQSNTATPQLLRFFLFYSWIIWALNSAFNAVLFLLSNTKIKMFYKKKILWLRRSYTHS